MYLFQCKQLYGASWKGIQTLKMSPQRNTVLNWPDGNRLSLVIVYGEREIIFLARSLARLKRHKTERKRRKEQLNKLCKNNKKYRGNTTKIIKNIMVILNSLAIAAVLWRSSHCEVHSIETKFSKKLTLVQNGFKHIVLLGSSAWLQNRSHFNVGLTHLTMQSS